VRDSKAQESRTRSLSSYSLYIQYLPREDKRNVTGIADPLLSPAGVGTVRASEHPQQEDARMQIDRRAFLATLGTAAAINAMPSEALADALEHHMIENLDAETTANELKVRLGTGLLFGGPLPDGKADAELKKLDRCRRNRHWSISLRSVLRQRQ
jgi:hypothetical protein